MMTFLSRTAGAFLVAFFVFFGSAAGQPGGKAPSRLHQNRFVIAGRVSDAKGLPVSHLPVRLSTSVRPVDPDPRVNMADMKVLDSRDTSSDGSYRLVIRVLPGRNRYYLSFYDSKRFDFVRFARPDRIDITRYVKSGGAHVYDFRLPFHGGWEKVQETLKAYPEKSPKARIIRKYGIAEEIRKGEGEKIAEVWWYYARGKNFGFKDGKLTEENTFMPVLK
jgi:hypothetical protein